MSYHNDVQKLEPGEVIQLIEIDGTGFGADILRFHAHSLPRESEELAASAGDEQRLKPRSIWRRGQEYEAYPYEITGLATTTDGSQPTPKLRVANISNVVTALCLAYSDLVQAKVSVHQTFVKYLDARNFPAGNSLADASQERVQVFYIDSKTAETNTVVEFQLATPFDLQGQQLPSRQIHGLCTWCIRGWYRTGRGCDYGGVAGFDKDDQPVDDPALDVCGGRVSSCRKRFGEAQPLSFGGFPGSNLLGK
ncbi:phage minor tail protein L [Serratia marcescens]|nr:phage minor tail protein L [Serratia marcescens]